MPVLRWFLLLILLLPVLAQSQQLHFNSRTFEYNNELLKVRKLYQDAEGFMWLGSSQGLFQYDGYGTKPVFLVNTSKPIPPVSAIFQDQQKRLWVGCETGQLFWLQNKQLKAFKPEEGTPKESILAILQDLKGNVWLATYGEGLYCWKNNRLYNFNTHDGLPDDYVYSLTMDKAGNIWAGTDRGIAICNFKTAKKQVQKIGMEQGLPDNIVTALAACPGKKNIWAGTYSGGFCMIDAETKKITVPEFSRNWQHGVITRLLPTTPDASLIATAGHGLWEYRTTEPNRLLALESAKDATVKISDLLFDQEGSVWIAGNNTEIRMASPTLRFQHLSAGKPEAGALAILPDKHGNIWFSTDEGLFCARKQTTGFEINPAFVNQPFRKYKVVSLFEDFTGNLWVGTFGGGVFRLNPETGKVAQFTEKNGLVNDNVLSITGKGQEIWLATLGGASRCKLVKKGPPQFSNFNQNGGIRFNYIYQVLADRKNRVWFATDGKGLTKLENGRFTNYSEAEGLTSKTIYSMAEMPDGNLWVSTPKQGLFKFDGKQFTNFSTSQGLRDLNIIGLNTDKRGNLLILHQKGLDILEPATGKMHYLGPESGLQRIGQDLNTMAKAADGTVWFGTQKAIVAYQPPAQELQRLPQTRLTSVLLFLKPIPAGHNQQFAHDENHISFDYAGLWYQNPEEVTYRLKLEGYDREWALSNNRSITYPKLPPGKYTFNVVASATGKFEKLDPVTYTFEIKEPFWNTSWFFVLALTAGGSLLFGLVKSREKRLKKAERLEKDKVMFQFETLKNQVNPHFLFNSFNTLIGIIEDDQDAAVAYVEKLSDFFRDILVYREKDTITLREELVLIQNYYFLQQKRYGSNLQMQVNVPENMQEFAVAPLTLQLLVENAIKHNIVSLDKPLTVEIFTAEDGYLVVRNNLQKKKQPVSSTGIGLANITKRYGILTKKPVQIIENATVFEIKIPLFIAP